MDGLSSKTIYFIEFLGNEDDPVMFIQEVWHLVTMSGITMAH